MLELTIPQAGEKAKNIKDLIFTILTQEEDLSLIELTNIIKNQYVLNVTYQAVRKAVNTLEQQDILFKKGKKYSLNKEWVLKTKAFFDTLAVTHESGKR